MLAMVSMPIAAQQTQGPGPALDDPLGVRTAQMGATPTQSTPAGTSGGRVEVTVPTADGSVRVVLPVAAEAGAVGDAQLNVPGEASLTTIFASNNSFAGNTFDVVPTVPITIIQTDVNLITAAGSHSVTIYYREGTAVGNENSSAGWRLLSATTSSFNSGTDLPSPVPHFPVTLLPGLVYGFYIDLSSYPSTSMAYTNGGPTTYTNAHLSITTNDGRASPAFTGGGFFPRQWNGTLHYNFAGPYVLDGYGALNPAGAGHAPAIPTPYFGFDIARDLEFLRVTGFYVLDGFGGIHAGDGAPSISPATPYFGFDIAKDLEVTLQCHFSPGATCQYYVLDGFGFVHAGGGAPALGSQPPYFGFDAAQDMELRGSGVYVLDAYGGLHVANGAPVLNPQPPYFGFDAARDLEFIALTQGGYYVLDKFGGLHPGGGAGPAPAGPYFGFDAAQDLELVPGGFYLLDKFGGLHAVGGSPTITPAPAYFGFNAARDLEFR